MNAAYLSREVVPSVKSVGSILLTWWRCDTSSEKARPVLAWLPPLGWCFRYFSWYLLSLCSVSQLTL